MSEAKDCCFVSLSFIFLCFVCLRFFVISVCSLLLLFGGVALSVRKNYEVKREASTDTSHTVGMVWHATVWHGMAWYGMVCHRKAWHGLVWYGMVWYGMYGATVEEALKAGADQRSDSQVHAGIDSGLAGASLIQVFTVVVGTHFTFLLMVV